jgi:hypothetical protein
VIRILTVPPTEPCASGGYWACSEASCYRGEGPSYVLARAREGDGRASEGKPRALTIIMASNSKTTDLRVRLEVGKRSNAVFTARKRCDPS